MSRYAIALCALLAGLLAPCVQPVASAQRLTRIIITPPDRRLPLGETRSMTAVGVFDRRTTQDITDEAEWFSSNTRAVVVSNDNDTR